LPQDDLPEGLFARDFGRLRELIEASDSPEDRAYAVAGPLAGSRRRPRLVLRCIRAYGPVSESAEAFHEHRATCRLGGCPPPGSAGAFVRLRYSGDLTESGGVP
jgi:hypothetical protein